MGKAAPRYTDLLWTARGFADESVPPRSWLLDEAVPHPSLGMLSAWRGSAKTYLALDLAFAVASRAEWAWWNVPVKRPVLYVDGEMPLGDLQKRVRDLGRWQPRDARHTELPTRLWLLASERLAAEGRGLNLAVKKERTELAQVLAHIEDQTGHEGLLILDNLSSLIRGIDENDNSALDPILEWMVVLRHGEWSVLLIHHHGKGEGGQRGASRREDILDWTLISKEDRGKRRRGHSEFELSWDKTRTGIPEPEHFRLVMNEETGPAGQRVALKYTRAGGGAGLPAGEQRVLDYVRENGPCDLVDLARTSRYAYEAAAKLEERGMLRRQEDGRWTTD